MVGHPVWGGPNFQKQGVFVHPFPTALTTIRNLKRLLTSVFILHIRKSILKGQRPEKKIKGSWTKRMLVCRTAGCSTPADALCMVQLVRGAGYLPTVLQYREDTSVH